jgi:transcriptional regulator with XRE-family HTH domain
MTQSDIARAAGAKLREQRERYGMTLEDVQQRTRERFGETGMVKYGHLSKIERGMLVKPPTVRVIASLAAVYNMNPAEIMEWYQLPVYMVTEVAEPSVITRAKLLLLELPPDQRTKLISLIEFAIAQVRAGAA